jgi:hypothetical protein
VDSPCQLDAADEERQELKDAVEAALSEKRGIERQLPELHGRLRNGAVDGLVKRRKGGNEGMRGLNEGGR